MNVIDSIWLFFFDKYITRNSNKKIVGQKAQGYKSNFSILEILNLNPLPLG